jgi:ATP-dependent Clp protease ATP-binding subunit ClpB
MNINKFTIKSQEAIQLSQQLAQGFGQQQIENEHVFKAIFDVDENVAPFILKKLNVNVPLFLQIDSTIQSFPKLLVAKLLARTANSALNEAENIAKKMNDELFPLSIYWPFCFQK